MGNICERLTGNEGKVSRDSNPIKAALQETIDDLATVIAPVVGVTDIVPPTQELVLRRLIDDAIVAKMTNMFLDEMTLYQPQMTLFKTVDRAPVAGTFLGMNLPLPDSSDLQSLMIQNFDLPSTAELFTYASLNPLVKINDSLVEDELIQWEATENTIYILNRVRTEKVLVVASRNMLLLRIVKKIDSDRYVSLIQTVDVTCLAEHPKIKEILENHSDNFATTFISGQFIENKDGIVRISSFIRTDFKSGVKMGFMKIFLNKGFEALIANNHKNIQTVQEKQHWGAAVPNPVWFQTDDGKPVPLSFAAEKTMVESQAPTIDASQA